MIHRVLIPLLLIAFVVSAQEPPSPEIQQLLASAQTKLKAKDVKGALEDFEKILELDPKLVGVWKASGDLKGRLGDHKGAIAAYTEALDIQEHAVLFRSRAIAKQQLKDYAAAEKDYAKSVELNANDANTFYGRARMRENMGDLEGALKDFKTVTSLAATFGQAYLNLANVKAALGKFKGAMEDYDNALFLIEGKAQSGVIMSRARTKMLMGDEKGAREDFANAVKMDPDSHQTLFSRGLFRFDQKMYKEAVADFRKSLEMDAAAHEYGRLYVCLARMYLGEKEAAQKEMGEYLDGREKQDDWFVKVAGFLAGRITEDDFLKATQDDNEYTTREQSCEAYWYVGATAHAAGDKKKALQFMGLCVAVRVHNFIEFQSSRAVLMRAEKANKASKATETEKPAKEKAPDKAK